MGNKILLADDSITIQKVVELVLSPEGFQISSFNNGEQALSEIDTIKPNIVLADVEMPKINGYDLCKKIKTNPSTANIPVILLVGAFEPFDENEARSVGADDFIIKPFESQELISKVKALIKEIPETTEFVDTEPIQEDESTTETAEVQEDKETEISFTDEDFAMLQGQVEDEQQPQEQLPEEKEGGSFKDILEEAVFSPQPADLKVDKPPISREEVLEIYKEVITTHVTTLFDNSFKEMISDVIKGKIEEIITNITPEIVEKTTKEMLNDVSIQVRDKTISILNHFVPEIAQEMIEREINKITADI